MSRVLVDQAAVEKLLLESRRWLRRGRALKVKAFFKPDRPELREAALLAGVRAETFSQAAQMVNRDYQSRSADLLSE